MLAAGTPSFGGQRIANQDYKQNAAIGALTLPEAAGADGAVAYSLSPAAPAELTFSTSARTLSGTPTGTQSATAYTYTATDGTGGETATLTFTIAVAADARPSFGGASIVNLTYTQNTAIAARTLPAATGGDGALSYSIGTLPAGLSFDAGTRGLSGTPTTEQAAADVTYTVTDADGDT